MLCLLCGVEHTRSQLFDAVNEHLAYRKYRCVDCDYGTAILADFLQHRDSQNHRMSSASFVDHFFFEHLSKIICEDFEYAEKHGIKALDKCVPVRTNLLDPQVSHGRCMICPMQMIGRSAVHEHVQEHLGYQPHRCSDCPFSTGMSSELESHRHRYNHCVLYRGNLHKYLERIVEIVSQDMFYMASNENVDPKTLFLGRMTRPLDTGEEVKQEVELSQMAGAKEPEQPTPPNRKRPHDIAEFFVKMEPSSQGESSPSMADARVDNNSNETMENSNSVKRHRKRSHRHSVSSDNRQEAPPVQEPEQHSIPEAQRSSRKRSRTPVARVVPERPTYDFGKSPSANQGRTPNLSRSTVETPTKARQTINARPQGSSSATHEPQKPSSSRQRSRTPVARVNPQTACTPYTMNGVLILGEADGTTAEAENQKKRQAPARVPRGSRSLPSEPAESLISIVKVPCMLCPTKPYITSDYLTRRYHTLTQHLHCDDSTPDFAEMLESTIRRCFPNQMVNSDNECNRCGNSCTTLDQRRKHVNTNHHVIRLLRCPVDGCTIDRTHPSELRDHIDTIHTEMTNAEGEAFARLSTDYFESMKKEMSTCFPIPIPKKSNVAKEPMFKPYGTVGALSDMMGGVVRRVNTESGGQRIIFESIRLRFPIPNTTKAVRRVAALANSTEVGQYSTPAIVVLEVIRKSRIDSEE
ncbi:hypothetical protein QR680_011581 [Steinernema hermaphroditum]|uniref:C2H2-type domain-containing protein n=1 Tax=Steinernema hermaphroditum TaxID=289476 RepID=A0AA39HYY9_9BILA|nr:hypothetical protein QR680_011581 [Steinernema hermaphroditum]